MLTEKFKETSRKVFNEENWQKTKSTTLTAVKYGLTFSGGVLVGTLCGVILFFKISDEVGSD